jgi:hypothetical protein
MLTVNYQSALTSRGPGHANIHIIATQPPETQDNKLIKDFLQPAVLLMWKTQGKSVFVEFASQNIFLKKYRTNIF